MSLKELKNEDEANELKTYDYIEEPIQNRF